MIKNKIGVFLSDFFWTSTPYDGLNLYHELNNSFDTDLIIFSKDIRLNKKFSGIEKFYFDKDEFLKAKSLKVINNWEDLKLVSKDYDIILSSPKIAPKHRFPKGIKLNCKWGLWDIGGVDILTTAASDPGWLSADYFFLKGHNWKNWVKKLSTKKRDADSIFTTGCPHYDYYLPNCPVKIGSPLSKKDFISKYELNPNNTNLLVMPSNPGTATHNKQFKQNLAMLEFLNENCVKHNVNLLLKTYPNDYLFYEKEMHYSGIYKRVFSDCPQYQWITDRFSSFKVIESQDHFAAMHICDKIFNIAGSSIGWETYFVNAKSISMNYSDKKYFGSLSYLPGIKFPDREMNHEIKNVEEIFSEAKVNKSHCDNFILKEFSLKNISKKVKGIIYAK